MRLVPLAAVLCALCVGMSTPGARAQSLVQLEELPAPAFANTAGVSRIADDGTVVGTGWSEGMVVRWRPGHAPEDLGGSFVTFTLENIMPLMSADGGVIATNFYYEIEPGNPKAGSHPKTAIWQGGTDWAPIGNRVLVEDTPFGISANGQYLVGTGVNPPEGDGDWVYRPWIWSEPTGQQTLDMPPDMARGEAWTVSDDGQTVAGFVSPAGMFVARYGVRWDAAVAQLIEDADGNPVGQAMACNSDCSLLVGAGMENTEGSKQAWRWTAEEGVVFLGTLPDADPGFPYYAFDASEDGRVIVGSYTLVGPNMDLRNRGFLWTQETGLVDIVDFLAANGIDYGADFLDLVVNNITRDGSMMLLNGSNPEYQRQRAVVHVVPVLAPGIFADGFEAVVE